MTGRNHGPSDRPPAPDRGRSARIAIIVVSALAVVVGLAFTVSGLGAPSPGTPPALPTAVGAAVGVYPDLSLVPVVTTEAVSSGPADAPSATASGGPATGTAPSGTDMPARQIRIARLDIDLKIIEGDGVDAPIGKVAHYPGTAWPGSGSNIYIYGHARDGMFINLWQAKVGDVVELDLVDGTVRSYLVGEVLPKVPWDAVNYLRPTESEQLTLQTSTSYHPTSPRFIVIAYPAP